MLKAHLDRDLYFEQQTYTTRKYVIPFIEKFKSINGNLKVLEIGCGDGGNLKPFLDMGCTVTGVDLEKAQISRAVNNFKNHPNRTRLNLICQDIYKMTGEDLKFDLIIMRDVIEHITDQRRLMSRIKSLMSEDCRVFIGYPPWQMPFGGHQQGCRSKLLSKLPYFHLLPWPIYELILKIFNESAYTINELHRVKETGISIEQLRKIIADEHYTVDAEELYLISPNYDIKFKLSPKRQFSLLARIPFLRNFFTTCCYYILSANKPQPKP